MVATSAPFGLRPVNNQTGVVRPRAYPAGVASGYNTGILKYQPVAMDTTGVITVVAAGSNDWIGVFAGCEYITTDGRHVVSNQWPANQTYTAGTMIAYVWDDPTIVYEVQTDETMAQTAIGDQSNFSNVTDGSTVTGLSAATIDTVVTAGQQGQVRIIELAPYVNNAFGDTYVVVHVMNARHQYVANKVAI